MDFRIQLHKRSKSRQLQHPALDHLANLVFLDRIFPRIFHQTLQGQRNTVVINGNDLGLYLLPNLHDIFRVLNALPSELGNVYEPFQAFSKFHKRPEIHHARDFTVHHIADRKLANFLQKLSFDNGSLGHNQFFAILLCGDDAHVKILADKTAQNRENLVFIAIFHPGIMRGGELGHRQETHHVVDAHHEPAFVGFEDLGFDDLARFQFLAQGLPHALQAGLAERQLEVAFFIFDLNHRAKYLIADFQ